MYRPAGCSWVWERRQGTFRYPPITLPGGRLRLPTSHSPEHAARVWEISGKQSCTSSQPWWAPALALFWRCLSSSHLRHAPLVWYARRHSMTGAGLVCFKSSLFHNKHADMYRRELGSQHTQHREDSTCPNLTTARRGLCLIYPGVSISSAESPVQAAGAPEGSEGVSGDRESVSAQDPDLWVTPSRTALGLTAFPRS